MNEPELQVTLDLDDHPAITAPELQLLAELLPELIKEVLWLQHESEA